jgi:hypothetical protein
MSNNDNNQYTGFQCMECNSGDGLILKDAPWVIECNKCGHPNDVRWETDDEFYDYLLDKVM